MTDNLPAKPRSELVLVEERSPKHRLVALTLGCFGGFLGLHRFYTGRYLSGLVMMLTLGGLLAWWVMDFFVLLTGRFKDSEGRVLGRPLALRRDEIDHLPPELKQQLPADPDELPVVNSDTDDEELLADPLEKKFEHLEQQTTKPGGTDGRP